MSETARKRALKNYRKRLEQSGLTRFEVLARRTDRELLRSLARALSEDDPEANRIRDALKRLTGKQSPMGGILSALRRSPLVGAELDLQRPVIPGRDIKL